MFSIFNMNPVKIFFRRFVCGKRLILKNNSSPIRPSKKCISSPDMPAMFHLGSDVSLVKIDLCNAWRLIRKSYVSAF